MGYRGVFSFAFVLFSISLLTMSGFSQSAFAGNGFSIDAEITNVATSSAADCAPPGTKRFDIDIQWTLTGSTPDFYRVNYLAGTEVWRPVACFDAPLVGTFADEINPNGPLTLPGADGEFCRIQGNFCSAENPIRGLFGQLTCGNSIVISVSGIITGIVEAESNILTVTNDCPAVGGELIPLDTTMVLVAGSQNTAAWMIPIIVSAIGIGIVIARKF